MDAANYSAYSGYAHLGAGLTVGMSSLAAGLAIGIVGDAGVRANAQQPRLFVGTASGSPGAPVEVGSRRV